MNESRLLDNLELRLGYRFQCRDYMRHALTHASTGGERDYERLEFLGDRVLGLVVADLLYKEFPNENEGALARRHAALVSGETLAVIAEKIDLGDVMHLSDGERAAGGAKKENLLSDVMEALIGAAYLDGGLEPCCGIIAGLWHDILHTMDTPPQDPKTALQEWAQARGLGLPEYTLERREGPDHAPLFYTNVRIEGFDPAIGEGSSRRMAEKSAATALIKKIGIPL